MNKSAGLAAGGGSAATTNGGIDWQDVATLERVKRFRIFGDTLGFASGAGVWRLRKVTTDIDLPEIPVAKNFQLDQNFPNPFNPGTVIRYSLSVVRSVNLDIYNLAGQRVRTLVSGKHNAGNYRVEWDGRDDAGRPAASGVYLYRLSVGDAAQSRKMILIR